MTALSIHLPEQMAKASQKAASQLGISRTEFIRQAIAHELELLEKNQELQSMAKGFESAKKNSEYLNEIDELDSGFKNKLPLDEDEWWKKK